MSEGPLWWVKPLFVDFIPHWAGSALAWIKAHALALKIAVAALAIAGAGWGGYQTGYKVKAGEVAQSETNALTTQLKAFTDAANKDREERAARYERDKALSDKLDGQQKQLAATSNTLRGRINALQEARSNFYLSLGAVRLLNTARGYSYPAGDGSTAATAELALADPQPSEIGIARLIDSDVGVATQYRSMQAQCNALIEWVNTELVPLNKQTPNQ